jgi:hypothetical protein
LYLSYDYYELFGDLSMIIVIVMPAALQVCLQASIAPKALVAHFGYDCLKLMSQHARCPKLLINYDESLMISLLVGPKAWPLSSFSLEISAVTSP